MSTKMLFVGPLKDFSGYASAARDYVRALDKAGCELATRDLRYDGGDFKLSTRELELAKASAQGVDIVIQQTTPNEMEPKKGCFNVGIFCWETDKIPDVWVHHLNKMDLILVPCDDNLYVARRCGVITPIEKIHYACDADRYTIEHEPYSMPQVDKAFKFLAVCQYSKKKGVDPLLKAYLSEFNQGENVCLILKTYFGPNDGRAEADKMRGIIDVVKRASRLKNYPPIHLIHEVLDFEQVDRLYATADCYCLPSRGEGWGVPHFDALGYGLPAIATRGTGPGEFITPQCGWLVDSHMNPVIDMPHPHDFLYTAKENWREPHVCDLKRCMREAFNLWDTNNRFPGLENDRWKQMQISARNRVKDFSHEVIGPQLKDVILKYYNAWRKVHVR